MCEMPARLLFDHHLTQADLDVPCDSAQEGAPTSPGASPPCATLTRLPSQRAHQTLFLPVPSIPHIPPPHAPFLTSSNLLPFPLGSLILGTHHSPSKAVAPSWCLDAWEGQGMNSSPTASGTVPRASDSPAAADKAEIPALPLRTWPLLHTSPVPTHRGSKFPIVSSIRPTLLGQRMLF